DLRDAITKQGKTRFVILGEPGCGKTTTLERLALDLAHQRLNDPRGAKIPLRVDLELFDETPIDPDKFVRNWWQKTGLVTGYDECVLNGEVCLLLDGVNQMPFDDRADRIDRWRTWVQGLSPRNWAVFTCRSLDYQPRLNIPEVHVQHLDANQVQRYLEIRLSDDERRRTNVADELERCLRSGDQRFMDLVRNIFMLTLLVERAIEEKPLSGNRADLMEDLALRRLDREFQRMRQPAKVRRKPQAAVLDEQLFLRRLAYQMQEQSGATAISAIEFSQKVTIRDKAVLLEDAEALKLGLDSGLLEEKRDSKENISYAFYHHLLHEYFAGQELLLRFRTKADLSAYWQVNWRTPDSIEPLPEDGQLPPPVTGWEETTRMAAAQAGADLEDFVKAVARHNLPLAGRCLAEAGMHSELAEEFRAKLLERQRSPGAHLRARIDAGLALGELGHPDLKPQPFSFEGKTVWAILPTMQPVGPGPFL
ncbi:MAG: NACHT domain-containing protein, partial [Anaerolineaceae bacterium]